MSVKLHERFQEAVEQADFAGVRAIEHVEVVPMVVYSPRDPVASLVGGNDGGPDLSQPVYHVPDGVCGFAWVQLYGKAGDGRRFLNWLQGRVKTARPVGPVYPDVMSAPRRDHYAGGVCLWVSAFGQSMQKKEAYANAFAASLRAAGVEGLVAYGMSRMD